MLPRIPGTRPHKSPSVFLKRDLVKISTSLTVEVTTPETLADTLGPIAYELIKVHGEYTGFGQKAGFKILKDILNDIWKNKERLKQKSPGKFIARTILQNLQLFYFKKGWQEKWIHIIEQMKEDMLINS